MTIDLERVLGHQLAPRQYSYDERDVSLYALSVGAGSDPLDPAELRFVYELDSGFQPLPTWSVTFPFVVMEQIFSVPGLSFQPMMLLHGEQYLELKRPLPVQATLTNQAQIVNVYDKGSGAVIVVDIHSLDELGQAVALNRTSLFIRGIGGFGGERGPSTATQDLPPQRPPDAVHRDQTRPDQALLYRLSSGDRNPLHADPSLAAFGGFERPILHGLCTFGFAGRAVLHHFAGNEPDRFKSMKARFSKHVYPGETILTEMWQVAPDQIIFQTKVAERDEVVLANASVVLTL